MSVVKRTRQFVTNSILANAMLPSIAYGEATNPIIWADVPDLAVIRVADAYYNPDHHHFMGYRFALFSYATETPGGYVDFDFFRIDNQITKSN